MLIGNKIHHLCEYVFSCEESNTKVDIRFQGVCNKDSRCMWLQAKMSIYMQVRDKVQCAESIHAYHTEHSCSEYGSASKNVKTIEALF